MQAISATLKSQSNAKTIFDWGVMPFMLEEWTTTKGGFLLSDSDNGMGDSTPVLSENENGMEATQVQKCLMSCALGLDRGPNYCIPSDLGSEL